MNPRFCTHICLCSHTHAKQAKPKESASQRTLTTVTANNMESRLTQTNERRATDNMGLASCGVTCLISSVVFQFNFSAGLTVLCPEIPHERQAQKRCEQVLPHSTNGTAVFFDRLQATLIDFIFLR